MLTIEKDGLEYYYPLDNMRFACFLVVLATFPILLLFSLVLLVFVSIVDAAVFFVSGIAILSLLLSEALS